MGRKSFVSIVESNTGIDHLLLAEGGQLVSAQCVFEPIHETVFPFEPGDISLQLLNGAIV